jgi:hypothetical protein
MVYLNTAIEVIAQAGNIDGIKNLNDAGIKLRKQNKLLR